MKSKKAAGIGGGLVVVAASIIGLLNQNPDDVRLPDHVVVAVYQDQTHDAFYGAPFQEVREKVQAEAEFYAVPKEALQKVSFKEEMLSREAKKSGWGSREYEAMKAYNFAAHGYPDSVWTITWEVPQVVSAGERLDPANDYPGRFVMKEGDGT